MRRAAGLFLIAVLCAGFGGPAVAASEPQTLRIALDTTPNTLNGLTTTQVVETFVASLRRCRQRQPPTASLSPRCPHRSHPRRPLCRSHRIERYCRVWSCARAWMETVLAQMRASQLELRRDVLVVLTPQQRAFVATTIGWLAVSAQASH